MIKKKKKRKAKVKYKIVKFKLSENQIKLIDHHCRIKKTTRNKVIKSAIKDFLVIYNNVNNTESYVTENQLQLFDSTHITENNLNIIH